MLNFLFTVIIYPLKEIIEFVYVLSMRLAKHPGFAIFGVSIAVTLLCLPLYAVAEKLQEEERETQKRLKPKVDKIKAVFKGDEQYMILSTYYRQNHYHPIYALRSSISLLIQIPFFIAAYSFLSHLSDLQGVRFLFINNLGAPDGLIKIGSLHLNFLPILMTLINCTAGAIYTKGFPLKDKLQLYGMALVFLLLLYTSPSGLVLYWTMNNVFSLIKNIFYKLKKPLLAFYIFCCSAMFLGNIYIYVKLDLSPIIKVLLSLICVCIALVPFIYKAIAPIFKKFLRPLYDDNKLRNSIFLFSCLGLCFLTGLVIPTNTISTNTADFCFINDFASPFPFIKAAFFQAIGLFIFWPCAFYFMFNKKIQTAISFVFSSALVGAIINTFAFTKISLTMNNIYEFTYNMPKVSAWLVNLLVLLIATAILCFIIYKFSRITNFAVVITAFAFLAITGINSVTINKDYKDQVRIHEQNLDVKVIEPVFHLSKTENNVIVIMIDRSISMYIAELFNERPDIKEKYDGFVYYPNSLSPAKFTNLGSPAMWGGYEYSPYNSNKRPEKSLLEKQNEALMLMPTIFANNGYKVCVSDLPYGNLSLNNDMSIFDGMENVTAFNTMQKYAKIWCEENNYVIVDKTQDIILRNTLWYSLFKISPEIARFFVYENGNFWSTEFKYEDNDKNFIDSYSVLDYLPKLVATDSTSPSCMFMNNETVHEITPLQLPDYELIKNVDNTGYSSLQTDLHYQANATAYIHLAKFFDYLREEGVYDNTRIIISSDHGYDITNAFDNDPFKGDTTNKRYRLNCTLLVKDFNSNEPLVTDYSFMTNCDTPYLATKGLIENPTNPFTGNEIKSEENKVNGFVVTSSDRHRYMQHGKNTFTIHNDEWFTVTDNIYDLNNWKDGTNE